MLVEELAVVQGVVLIFFVSPAHVEVAIGAKLKIASVVIGGVVDHFNQDCFRVGIGDGVGDVGIDPT